LNSSFRSSPEQLPTFPACQRVARRKPPVRQVQRWMESTDFTWSSRFVFLQSETCLLLCRPFPLTALPHPVTKRCCCSFLLLESETRDFCQGLATPRLPDAPRLLHVPLLSPRFLPVMPSSQASFPPLSP